MPAPPLLWFLPFRSSGAGILTHGGGGGREKCPAGERQPGASTSSPQAVIAFPSPGLDGSGKSKLQQETEYLFGLDGVGLAVNQKFSLTSSRKRQEVPVPLPWLSPNPQCHHQHVPQVQAGGPCLALGWLLAAQSRDVSPSEGPGPDCDQEDIRGQSLRETARDSLREYDRSTAPGP